jgi:GPH family glycoside/pentoside/hexuronide:cation symporter
MGTRIGWGFGGIADNYMVNVLNMLFLVIYVQYFKMPPVLAGIAFAIPRFVDALTDPLIGNISDNTRSKWGRRRPYMVAGAILSAILLPFFWTPLGNATSGVWYQNMPFIYTIVIGIVFAVTYTLYVVPYTALGYELTNDYDEKTRVLSWRMYIGLIGSLTVPWVYQLAQNDAFKNEGSGAFWVSVGVGVFVIVTGLIPVLVCREREDVQLQKTSPFGESLKATMTNRPFVILLVAYIIIIVGLFSAGNLGAFVNIYYICGGNKDFGALLVAVAGTLGAIVSYLSMFLITAVSVRTGKKTAMFLGLGFALIGVLGAWFAMDPRWPLAQLWTTVISCMGLQGCWLMVSSMVADICDEDELKTGLRREGMFGAVNGFALKAALSVTALIGGVLLQYTGFSSDEVDQFQSRTITQLIEPARVWELAEGDFKTATATFDLSATRFIEISEDKSGMEGSKLTIFSRLLKGENVFFRWYDFENALNSYLDAVSICEPTASAPLKAELATFVKQAHDGFLTEFKEQKRIALLMKKLIIGCQAVGLALAMAVFAYYPITRKYAEETRRKLDERKANEVDH